jgi:hypothetical protein
LAKVEPTLVEAKKNVDKISNNDLNTIKTFNRPPALVEFALKPIYYMINKESRFLPRQGRDVTWDEIKKFMSNNFIKQIH